MGNELERPLAAAIVIAREAGALIRNEFHRSAGPRGDNVAHADVDDEAEAFIRARLLAEFPGWGYRGEETGSANMDPPPRDIWLVDPNDGTRNFLQGTRGSAVSIALLRDRQPVLGVVYSPCAPDDTGDLIAWAEGCGPPIRNGEPFARDPWPEHLGSHEMILVSHDIEGVAGNALRLAAPARYRALPSIAYRLALAAAGDGVVGTSFKGAGDWDYAGGQALLRANGAELFSEQGLPEVYSERGESRSRMCLGGPLSVVRELLDRPWGSVYQRNRGPRRRSYPTFIPRAALRKGQSIADAGLLGRAQGVLLGQLAGDSLGSLVEFQPPEVIASAYPGGLRNLVDGGPFHTMAGQPTDDSELALMLGRSLLGAGGYDRELGARAYGYWYESDPFDIGATTARALRAIPPNVWVSQRPGLGDTASEAATQAADVESQSNGSLMRISPLAVWGSRLDPNVLADLARADSQLTHPNAVCQEACAVYVVALAFAVRSGANPTEVFDFARRWAERFGRSTEVLGALTSAEQAAPADFLTHAGWVLVALQNAFYQVLHAPTAEEGIVATVMSGGDTDTNAAIAGALLGACHGRDAIPRRWRNLILSCRPLTGIPGVAQPRPAPFWPVDALELAEQLLLIGS